MHRDFPPLPEFLLFFFPLLASSTFITRIISWNIWKSDENVEYQYYVFYDKVLLDLIWKQIRSFSFLPPQYTSVTLILLFADVSWCPILPPPNSSATAFPCSFETTLSWSRSHLLPMNSTGLHVWGVELYGMNHNFDIVVSWRNSRKKERKKHFI